MPNGGRKIYFCIAGYFCDFFLLGSPKVYTHTYTLQRREKQKIKMKKIEFLEVTISGDLKRARRKSRTVKIKGPKTKGICADEKKKKNLISAESLSVAN